MKSETRSTGLRPRVSRTLIGLIGGLALLGAGTALAVPLTAVSSFGSNPGNLKMYKYVPAGLASGAPLVVVLHGCSQTAQKYADAGGWHKFADKDRFALLFPEQQSANNGSSCFNWFEAGDIARGQGEAQSIKSMVDKMKADHGIDAQRVFVTGLSAGGAFTNVLLATYPDVFKGGAPIAGIPYKCGVGMSAGFSCMSGVDKTPQQWGDLARGGYAGYTGRMPVVSIWHGDSDYTVNPKNPNEIMEQWTNVNGIDQTADANATVSGHQKKTYRDASGADRVEWYTLTGMAHGTPLDPGTGEAQCGTATSYMLDVNICSSYHIGRFWGIVAKVDNDGTGGGDTGGGDGGSGGGDTAECWTSSNAEHAAAGRANAYGAAHYAKGSWQYMGYGTGIVKSLKLTKPGYYEIVPSC